VEVVADTRIPDTSGEADGAKDEQSKHKVPESAEESLLLGSWGRGRGRSRRLGSVYSSGLGLSDIVNGGLVDLVRGDRLGVRQDGGGFGLGLLVDSIVTLER
jgi:hypothetical protein